MFDISDVDRRQIDLRSLLVIILNELYFGVIQTTKRTLDRLYPIMGRIWSVKADDVPAMKMSHDQADALKTGGCLSVPSIGPVIKQFRCNQPLVGNSLRIQIIGRTEYLTLCEVKVFSALSENIAASKGTSQSSTDNAALSSRAVDGDRNSDFGQGSCSSTESSAKEWWQVDLGDSFDVTNLLVVTPKNRGGLQFDIFEVLVGENEHEWKSKDSLACRKNIKIFRGKITGFLCDCPVKGRYVRIQRKGKGKVMLCEVEVFSKDALEEQGGKNARCVANDCDKEKLRPRKPV